MVASTTDDGREAVVATGRPEGATSGTRVQLVSSPAAGRLTTGRHAYRDGDL